MSLDREKVKRMGFLQIQQSSFTSKRNRLSTNAFQISLIHFAIISYLWRQLPSRLWHYYYNFDATCKIPFPGSPTDADSMWQTFLAKAEHSLTSGHGWEPLQIAPSWLPGSISQHLSSQYFKCNSDLFFFSTVTHMESNDINHDKLRFLLAHCVPRQKTGHPTMNCPNLRAKSIYPPWN